jgi:hypothetical protein
MEVLQISRGRSSCCLVLVWPRQLPRFPGVWAQLDNVWTTFLAARLLGKNLLHKQTAVYRVRSAGIAPSPTSEHRISKGCAR